MKANTPYRLLLSLGAAGTLVFAGCSKQDRETAADKMEHAYNTSTEAVADTWDDLKDYTFDKSAEFKRRAEAVSSDLDAKVAKLKADYKGEQASAARKAAMDRVTSAQTTLSEKLAALRSASAATWESAKAEVIAATKKLEAAYDDAVADTANQ